MTLAASRGAPREALAGRAVCVCYIIWVGWLGRDVGWLYVSFSHQIQNVIKLNSIVTGAGLVCGFWIRALCTIVIHGDVPALSDLGF